MTKIPLSQGKFAKVDDADFEWLNQWKWHAVKKILKNRTIWYASRNLSLGGKKQRALQMHRQLVGVAGADHADGDGLNNQRFNLRPANRGQNGQNANKRPKCSSQFKGVSWDKQSGKWRSYIRVDTRLRLLGFFTDEREAADVYNQAAKLHFGVFAKLNQL